MRESASTSHVRLMAAQNNILLWRNNVGSYEDEKSGRWIRYGLCNESKKQNKVIKSSDHVGIRPVLITPDMVGSVVGVFIAVENKATGWKLLPSDERGLAQLNFHDIVRNAGGFAGFATDVNDFKKIARL